MNYLKLKKQQKKNSKIFVSNIFTHIFIQLRYMVNFNNWSDTDIYKSLRPISLSELSPQKWPLEGIAGICEFRNY